MLFKITPDNVLLRWLSAESGRSRIGDKCSLLSGMKKLQWFDDQEIERRVHGLYEYEQVEVPKMPPERRLKSWDEVVQGYTHAQARVEALRCMQCQDPPCVKACPAHLDVPGYCQAIVDGDLQRGLQIILEAFPIPGACARVCYHPCTDVCLKGVEGVPIEIPRLRRYITDNVGQHEINCEIPPPTGFRIAIIGSGPAGLSCAYHLRRRGHHVVVFEKSDKAGGTLNTIPDYRLPDRVLQEEIKVLRGLGIEIRTNSPIQGDGCLDTLLQEFDAVFISVGAVKAKSLDVTGAELMGVYHGYELLRRLDAGEKLLGRKAAIIGGGDVAMDSLRTALRACDEVHFVYRRSPLEMPANPEEVFELTEEVLQQEWHHLALEIATERRKEQFKKLFARLELLTMERMSQIEKTLKGTLKAETFAKFDRQVGNLVVHFMAHPAQVVGKDGRATGVELTRMKLGAPDEKGRRQPAAIPGSEFVIEADTVIFAIGQEINLSWLGRDHGLKTAAGNRIVTDKNFETSRSRVFAGGDAVRGPASMIEAMGDGRYAAEAIDTKLQVRA